MAGQWLTAHERQWQRLSRQRQLQPAVPASADGSRGLAGVWPALDVHAHREQHAACRHPDCGRMPAASTIEIEMPIVRTGQIRDAFFAP